MCFTLVTLLSQAADRDLQGRPWREAIAAVLRPGQNDSLMAAAAHTLPLVVVLRGGRYSLWETGLAAHDFVDVLSRLQPEVGRSGGSVPPPPSLLTISAGNFSEVSSRTPLLLLSFVTSWCARCAELTMQLNRAVPPARFRAHGTRYTPLHPVTPPAHHRYTTVTPPFRTHGARDDTGVRNGCNAAWSRATT